MITKIISGGQTGVDRAALDAAIKLGIPHGGWVPKGRRTEDGALPERYRVRETATPVYAERTEKNVLAADGTLIISRGKLTGGSRVTRQMAEKHARPWLHVDLGLVPAFKAALAIKEWLTANRIAVLNVAGPRASKDPRIYRDALALIESAYYLHLGDAPRDAGRPAAAAPDSQPRKVKEAAARLIAALALKDRVTIANMTAPELAGLMPRLGAYLIEQFGPLTGDTPLARSCRWVAKKNIAKEADAARVILEAAWDLLRKTHTLRRVK
jgi:hypothetical protein